MKFNLTVIFIVFALISCHETESKSDESTEIIEQEKVIEQEEVEDSKHIFIGNDSIFPLELLLNEGVTDITFDNTRFSTIPKSAKKLTKVRNVSFIHQKSFPEGIHHFPNLKDIGFLFSVANELPSDINLCKNLYSIGINETFVKSIPSLCNLYKLEYLLITNSFVKYLPEDLDCLKLKDIVLVSTKIENIPESFFEMSSLESMTIDTQINNVSKMRLEKAFPNAKIYFEE